MSDPGPVPGIESKLDRALRQFDEERRRLEAVQTGIAETTTTVQTKDRTLSVTLDGRGDLTKLTFHGTRYRRLAPTELATLIVETLSTARSQALAKVGDMMGQDPLPGISFAELASGSRGVADVLNSFLGTALEQLPEQAQVRAGRLLERGGF